MVYGPRFSRATYRYCPSAMFLSSFSNLQLFGHDNDNLIARGKKLGKLMDLFLLIILTRSPFNFLFCLYGTYCALEKACSHTQKSGGTRHSTLLTSLVAF
jgi:hypothetical protein